MIFALMFTFFLLYLVDDSDDNRTIVYLFPSFSFSFMIIFCLFGIGINIQTFRKYRINYIYIFEIEPNLRLTQEKIYKVSFLINFQGFITSVNYLVNIASTYLCKCAQ